MFDFAWCVLKNIMSENVMNKKLLYSVAKENYIYLYEKRISLKAEIKYDKLWKEWNKDDCLNSSHRDEKIIISLTSFPARISTCHKTIRSLLMQNGVKPDAVELWLAEEEFPLKEKELPPKLLELCEHGLNICWCDNIRSYKKLLPSLNKHKEDIIVTADDDVYYSQNWLEKLFISYKDFPNSIHCHKATKFYFSEGKWEYIGGGNEYYDNSSYLNKLVGVGGVLYPPGCLSPEVLDIAKCMELAPTNDDIWFWLLGVKNGTSVKVCTDPEASPIEALNRNRSPKLCDINDCENGLFRTQLNNILNNYPEINEKMFDAWNMDRR